VVHSLVMEGVSPYPVPPDELMFRVIGVQHADHQEFLASGRIMVEHVRDVLGTIGRDLESFSDSLDFGCGCGRVTSNLYGCDQDAAAIRWCQDHLSFGTFAVNDTLPPLPYDDRSFDFLLAISVFTHINEVAGLLWLNEVRRVLRPDGIALITVHGEGGLGPLNDEARQRLGAQGFVFTETPFWNGHFPAWYARANHTRAYVESTFGRYFEVLSYVSGDRFAANGQDHVVVRKDERIIPTNHDEAMLRAQWTVDYITALERKNETLIAENAAFRHELEKATEYARGLERRLA
jgi:SAM-dependent methyltransferase